MPPAIHYSLSNIHCPAARHYHPTLSIWLSVDPMADKYPGVSPYTYCAGNPVRIFDEDGREISDHIDKYGKIIAHYDDNDNGVYVHTDGTTKSDIDQQRSELHNTGGKGVRIGERGGTININIIYSNLLKRDMGIAKGIYNPFKFKKLVKNHGDWDLKNNKDYIYGLGNDNKSKFNFNGEIMEAQDIGNHHFGAVACAFGFSEEFALRQAGAAQIAAGASLPEWRIYENPNNNRVPDDLMIIPIPKLLPPYGDDPRDQNWIKLGYKYTRTH